MEALKDILIDIIDDVKKEDIQAYKALEIRLYHILYGDKLCESTPGSGSRNSNATTAEEAKSGA